MGLYILIPLSVLLVFVIGLIFWWSLRSGQYDDLEGPAVRLLMDDEDDEAGDGGRSAAREPEQGGEDEGCAAKQHKD